MSFYMVVRVFFFFHFHCCLVFHCISITWFIHFSVGHLGGFQFLAITCKSALNILVCVLWWTCIYSYSCVELFGAHLYRVGMLGHRVCIYWDFIEYFNVYLTMGLPCTNLSNVFPSSIPILCYKLFAVICAALKTGSCPFLLLPLTLQFLLIQPCHLPLIIFLDAGLVHMPFLWFGDSLLLPVIM